MYIVHHNPANSAGRSMHTYSIIVSICQHASHYHLLWFCFCLTLLVFTVGYTNGPQYGGKMNGGISPSCTDACQICPSPLTVRHILIDCICFSAALQRYFGVNTFQELFENVESQNTVAFIKDTNFFHCI